MKPETIAAIRDSPIVLVLSELGHLGADTTLWSSRWPQRESKPRPGQCTM